MSLQRIWYQKKALIKVFLLTTKTILVMWSKLRGTGFEIMTFTLSTHQMRMLQSEKNHFYICQKNLTHAPRDLALVGFYYVGHGDKNPLFLLQGIINELESRRQPLCIFTYLIRKFQVST